jgi:tetratricopeptide (TPR) repeat protein
VIRTRTIHPRRAWILLAAITLAAVATVWIGRVPGTRVSQRVTQLTRLWTDPSFMNRFVFFTAASEMVRDHPVTGVGFESFALLYPRHRPIEGAAVPEDTVPSMVHNGYLQLAVTTGVPSLTLYLSLITSLVMRLMRTLRTRGHPRPGTDQERVIAAAFVGSVAGYLVQDLSGWPEISLSACFWTIAGLGVSYSTAGRSEEPWKIPALGRLLLGGLALAASLATGILAYDAFRLMRADRAFATASRLDVTRNWPNITTQLATALEIVGDDAHYLDEAGVLCLERLRASGERRAYDEGVALLERARSANAFDPYTLIHRIDLEAAALQVKIVQAPSASALAAVAAALDIDHNNSSVHESVARFELAAQRPSDALKAIEAARTLRPTRSGYRITEGDILRALGEKSRAIAAYRSELPLHPEPDEAWVAAGHKLVAALVESADYRSAVTEGLEFVTRLPRDATGQVLLGVAYRGLNDVESAKAAFAAALAIDPSSSTARRGHREAEQELERLRDVRGAPSPR